MAIEDEFLPIPVPVEVPPGYWQREASHYPQPLSPFGRSTLMLDINAAFRDVFAATGAFIDGIEFREIGGWVFNRQVPMGGKDRKPPPPFVFKILLKTVPALRARLKKNLKAIRDDTAWRDLEAWLNEWKSEQIAQIAGFRAADMTAMDDAAFSQHLAAVIEFSRRSTDRHFRLTPPGLVVAELVFACQDLLGWDERKALSLLTGLSTTSTEPAEKLAELSRMVAARPTVQALIASPAASTISALRKAEPEFAAAFDAYQHAYGFRALRYEVSEPTLIEVPEVTLGLIRDQVKRGYDPAAERQTAERARANAMAEARAALGGRSALERERFECCLERAQAYYPVREDNEFYTVSAPLAVVRFAVLELGRRMAERGQLTAAADAFWLEWAECSAAFTTGDDCRETVKRRKGERAWVLAHPAPASYGKHPGPPPDPNLFPPEAAASLKAMLWMVDRVFENDQSQQVQTEPRRIKGIGAAPGTYTGPVRVIRNEDEFDKIQAGDVLVCPITSPVWSVLFPSVGALVTDTGGILSHPAIISREYGVPAVVATGNATSILKDGQMVTVDGATGLVTTA